jgi:hypothetical protein
MSPTLTCLALALVGVDLGFRPASNGGTDFILHVSPATLQALRRGDPPIEFDVQREAQGLRASHFCITPYDAKLPNEVSVAAMLPPARAPVGPASPVLPALATSSPTPPYMSPDTGPVSVPPPSSGRSPRAPGAESDATGPLAGAARRPGGEPVGVPPSSVRPEQNGMEQNGARPGMPANSTSAESTIPEMPRVNASGGNSPQPDRPWLLMCLLVIALSASNSYIGWLFWDARQRYRGLLARTFSMGRQAAEA